MKDAKTFTVSIIAITLIAAVLSSSATEVGVGRGAHPSRPPLPPLLQQRFVAMELSDDATTNVTRRADSKVVCSDAFGKKCELCCGPAPQGQCCEDVYAAPGLADDVDTIAFTVRFTLIVDDTNSRNWSLGSDDVSDQLRVLNNEFQNSGSRFRFQIQTPAAPTTAAYRSDDQSGAVRVINSTLLSKSCATDSCYDNPSSCAFNRLVLPHVNSTPHLDVNVIVCDIHYDGESQFPWATSDEASYLQYIQIRYNAFFGKGVGTPRDGGMTLVHEMGHYLGLLHTFDGDCSGSGDYVADTPPAAHAANPKNPCDKVDASQYCASSSNVQQQAPAPDASNFMDYAADRCMRHFTRGQVHRMEQATLKYRPFLVNNSTETFVRYRNASFINSSDVRFSVFDREWWAPGNSNARALLLISTYLGIGAAACVLVTRSARRRYRPVRFVESGGESGDTVANEGRAGDDAAHDEIEDLAEGPPAFPWSPKWLRRHYRRRPKQAQSS
jgi:hypothetical protein